MQDPSSKLTKSYKYTELTVLLSQYDEAVVEYDGKQVYYFANHNFFYRFFTSFHFFCSFYKSRIYFFNVL